ncbi:hypothetical protein K501DRAFT_329738 [Backusella circina FSU 941]|nr:hypothetical protein K501DRAFT_264235 [Backusella circina FSU 941]KAI8888619.1 hypothetical protein K501DRAFT_329738 [Backusella circina FSU 941]
MADANNERKPRWLFRKEKKLERRRLKRQTKAVDRSTPPPTQVAVDPDYEQQKALWEEREKKHTIIELARKRAQETERQAKELSMKKWKETLLNLPVTPTFQPASKKPNTLKVFVPQQTRKTYRERFLEQKAKQKSD